MKNLICLFGVFISLLSFGKDQYKINLVSQSVNSVIIDFEMDKYELIDINKNSSDSYQKLMVEGGVSTLVKGEPELLKFTSNIQLPFKGVSNFSIISADFIELENVNIAPSKGNLYRNTDPNSVQLQKGTVYSTDSDFPSEVFSLGQPYIHRDVRGQTISFIPFGFNPVRKTIKIYNKIRVKITLSKETD